MSSNSDEVVGKKSDAPFIYTWKLDYLFPSTSDSGGNWDFSHAFPRGGYNWKLASCSMETNELVPERFLSLFLSIGDVDSLPLHVVIEITVESSIVNESNHYGKRKVVHKFRTGKSEEHYPFLMPLETLNCPSSGFLIVEIVDLVVLEEEEKEHLPPELVNDSCVYTWKIDGFSKLTKEKYTSGPFLIEDHMWHLILYPKGNKPNVDYCLSLYLEPDIASTLPPSIKIHFDFCLDLVDQINGRNHRKEVSCYFSSEEANWGFLKFISLDDLHEPSKGFLVNDCCIIKVAIHKLTAS